MRTKLAMLVFTIALGVNAEPVFKFINAKNAGENFEMTGASVMSSDLIPVEQLKNYRISGSFKNPLGVPVKLLFGVASFDSNKKEISTVSVSAVGGTDTVLAGDCAPEDKIIKVKDASAWKTSGDSTVVFETDPELKDIPNHNFAKAHIESINKKGDIWEIKLKGSCGQDYQGGTAVRQHYDGNTYVYVVISEMAANSEWTKFEGTVKKQTSKKIAPPSNVEYLRFGTAFVKIYIGGSPSNKLLFKDIDFTLSP